MKISRGFTVVELLTTIAIVVILLSLGGYSYSRYKDSKVVIVTANEISSKLEQAKSNAIAGKNGSNFGIHFATDGYTYFQGSSFSSSDANNISPSFPVDYEIIASLTGGASDIVFSKIYGKPNATGTITVQKIGNASTTKTITIGNLGDISVVQ